MAKFITVTLCNPEKTIQLVSADHIITFVRDGDNKAIEAAKPKPEKVEKRHAHSKSH